MNEIIKNRDIHFKRTFRGKNESGEIILLNLRRLKNYHFTLLFFTTIKKAFPVPSLTVIALKCRQKFINYSENSKNISLWMSICASPWDLAHSRYLYFPFPGHNCFLLLMLIIMYNLAMNYSLITSS